MPHPALIKELRVLSGIAGNPARLSDLRWRLRLIELAAHPSIRSVLAESLDQNPPTIMLSLPGDIDPRRHRLSDQIDGLSPRHRIALATDLVDALAAAHRVGLRQESRLVECILAAPGSNGEFITAIDLTGLQVGEHMGATQQVLPTSRDVELDELRTLMRALLLPIFTTVSGISPTSWGREIDWDDLQSLIANDEEHDESSPPTLSRWQQLFSKGSLATENDFAHDLGANRNSGGDRGDGVNADLRERDLAERNLAERDIGERDIGKPNIGEQCTEEIIRRDSDPTVTLGGEITPAMTQPVPGSGRPPSQAGMVPGQLGRFRIEELIGEGGMGRVYRGVDLANNSDVAIKVLRRHRAEVARSVSRFRKEARLLADVQNDHVTRLIEVGEDRGYHFLAMEYIDGIDLKRWFSAHSHLDEPTALKLVADISRALVDAHARDVIHRDIKPENVLLQFIGDASLSTAYRDRPLSDFRVKLTDFGIARHIHQTTSMEKTPDGMIMGTPQYMSPEQFDSDAAVRPTADIYSLGVTLFEMLTGAPPFRAEVVMQLGTMHRHKAPPSVQKTRNEISDLTASLVARSLAKAPSERYGDAAQFLAAIEQVLRGEATSFAAHPRAPETSQGNIWDKTKSWELASTPGELWPFVSDTHRLNHALGLPAVQYRSEFDPEVGLRQFGSFRLSGLHVAWEEHPFEWIEGQRMGILREFTSGPFTWFLSIVTFERTDRGGTRLSHQVRIAPRNLLGRFVAVVEADWKGFRNLDRVYQRIDRVIQQRRFVCDGTDPFEKPARISKGQRTRLEERIARVMNDGIAPDIAEKLGNWIRTGASQELAAIHPLQLAETLQVDAQSMVDTCLVAAHRGLLQLRWDILCPTCRAPAATTARLSEIATHTACPACDVEFQSNVENAIEMVFRVHPEIRQANDSQYCIGGPEHAPHVVAQMRIEPHERLTLPLDLSSGDYLIRGPRLPRTQSIRVRDTSAPSSLERTLSEIGGDIHVPVLRRGQQSITLTNDFDTLHVVRLERSISRDDVVTATAAASMPKFRELFTNQSLSSENPVSSEQVTLLAISINNIDAISAKLGDIEVYQCTHDLISLAKNTVAAHRGSVTRTMGEKLLAAFDRREQAVQAAVQIRDEWQSHIPPLDSQLDLQIGIGIHCGATLVTTENDRLDYYGTSVRAVSALANQCGGNILLTEVVASDPEVTALLPWNMELDTIHLPGIGATRVRRLGQV